MAAKTKNGTRELLKMIMAGDNKVSPILPYTPQKMRFDKEADPGEPLPRSTPESQGISSFLLRRFLTSLMNDREVNAHGIMVLKNGNVICETSFAPYEQNTWHVMYSLSKSITGLAVGLLIDEGKLSPDEKVLDILNYKVSPFALLRHKNLTVRHLLMMSSGTVFNEGGSVTEEDWVTGYLEAAVKFEPGERFYYNSMNSYLLSAVVKIRSGQGLMEYLGPRLWEPLDIRKAYWETCPRGIEKGGWGLYLRLEDMAKIGQLYLQRGNWKGRQLVSEQWIKESTRRQIKTREEDLCDYGYQIWTMRDDKGFIFNGMLGQNIIVYPEKDMVVATTAGNDEMFMDSNMIRIILEFFGGDFKPQDKLPENTAEYSRLISLEQKLSGHASVAEFSRKRGGWPGKKVRQAGPSKNCFAEQLRWLDGKRYQMEDTRASFLPLMMQVVHNNYSEGIHTLSFERKGKCLLCTIAEENADYPVLLGIGRAEYQEIRIKKDVYRIAARGDFARDEEGRIVLKIKIDFLEAPNTRLIRIHFEAGRILTKWDEIPGTPLIVKALPALGGPGQKKQQLQKLLIERLGSDYLLYRTRQIMEIKVNGRLISADLYEVLNE
ncbi:serine hydrolase [Anaerolentibacter hominis]|uniref:serine hydrolase domain-containing protein n=1 Tax=Anaerolentibacter hominis TaxID=3079009 RepID=UPI0031B84794